LLGRSQFLSLALVAAAAGPGGRAKMSERDVIANQKRILGNQKAIVANQGEIKLNQQTIKKNQAAILKNQRILNTIVENQKRILSLLSN
jgi:hypothetical protein